MIQQINLYQNGGKQGNAIFRNPYVLAVIGVSAYLLIASVVANRSLHDSQTELQQLQSRLAQAQADLQTLQTQYPNQQVDGLLNREIQQSQTAYQSLSHVLELLADDNSDQTQGFSRYLSALATQADSNVWITGINIESASDSIRLQGSTYKPEQIALLLERIQNTGPFKTRHFAKLTIQQSSAAAELSEFSVSANFKDDKEARHVGNH
jgi:cytidine deaminase